MINTISLSKPDCARVSLLIVTDGPKGQLA